MDNVYDVNADQVVTPQDALLVANDLTARGDGQLPSVYQPPVDGSNRYVDVDGDQWLTSTDYEALAAAISQVYVDARESAPTSSDMSGSSTVLDTASFSPEPSPTSAPIPTSGSLPDGAQLPGSEGTALPSPSSDPSASPPASPSADSTTGGGDMMDELVPVNNDGSATGLNGALIGGAALPSISVTKLDDARDFVVRGRFMDQDDGLFGPNGVAGDDELMSWSRTIRATCSAADGTLHIDLLAVNLESAISDFIPGPTFGSDVDYNQSKTSATVTVSSSFLWDGDDPGFWDVVSIVSTGATVGALVGGFAGTNPVTGAIGGLIGAAAGGVVAVGASVVGEEPMGSAASVTMTIDCVKAPANSHESQYLAKDWTPSWGTGPTAVTVSQRGDGYQEFVATGWTYYPPGGGYLPGQVHEDVKLMSTPHT